LVTNILSSEERVLTGKESTELGESRALEMAAQKEPGKRSRNRK
jgi:hypothetical protein